MRTSCVSPLLGLVASSRLVWSYQPERSPPHTASNRLLWREHEYCRATIDFTSANDYIQGQYGYQPSVQQPYFRRGLKRNTPTYDARKGVFDGHAFRPPSLDFCGFQMIRVEDSSSLRHSPTVLDWDDLTQIQQHYLPSLRKYIQEESDLFAGCKVLDVIFWHPVLRGQDYARTERFDDCQHQTSHMAVADVAHIDIDFGAFDDCHSIAELVYKSHIREQSRPPLVLEDLQELLLPRHRRFVMLNAWRNVQPEAVQSAPLALMHPSPKQVCFPDTAPKEDVPWYCFPELTRDEILLFLQYDRQTTTCSDIWHQALPEIGTLPRIQHRPRKSFDVRMMIVLEQDVPVESDRLHPNRTRAKGDDKHVESEGQA